MRKIILLFTLIISFGCKPKEVIITTDEVKETLSYLASDELEGRNTGSAGIELSAKFIEDKFKSYGVKSYYETYRDEYKIDSINAFNVIGFIEGSDKDLKEEIILIGAHFDHIGYRTRTVENDSLGNGANDNASGTAAVVALSRYFAERNNNKRSIMFALFSGEEMGLRGSRHLAKRLKNENANIYTVLNFEMIGVPFIDRNYDVFVTGYDLSNMAEKMNTYVGGDTLVGKSDVAKKYNLFKRSDNYAFYTELDVPSQTISSCDLTNYDFYHHVDDEIDKMDFEHMASLINKVSPAIEVMTNTATKEIKMHPQTEDE